MAMDDVFSRCWATISRRRREWILMFVVLNIVLFSLICKAIWINTDDGIVRHLLNDPTIICDEPLRQDVDKVKSYKFPGIGRYAWLFSGPTYTENVVMPSIPVFLSAFSSNHFEEGIELVNGINTLRNKFPNLKFIIYDIGLSETEKQKLLSICNCEISVFPFSRFPDWVKEIPTYTFKPLSIQLVAREHPFVMWVDTSVRFTTVELQPLFDRAKTLGVLATRTDGSIAQRTHPNTFKFFEESPCTFKSASEVQGGFQVIYANQFVREVYLRSMVSCALTFGCMVPEANSLRFINCGHHGDVYHDCHRFDQSIVGILLHRLYEDNLEQHIVKNDFVIFDKS